VKAPSGLAFTEFLGHGADGPLGMGAGFDLLRPYVASGLWA